MSRVTIAGRVFKSTRAVFDWAVARKRFKGKVGTIQRRLSRGVREWAELLAPLRPYGARNRSPGAAKAAVRELAATMAALKAIKPGKATPVKRKRKKVAKATPVKRKRKTLPRIPAPIDSARAAGAS
jgi:hypothetical protein